MNKRKYRIIEKYSITSGKYYIVQWSTFFGWRTDMGWDCGATWEWEYGSIEEAQRSIDKMKKARGFESCVVKEI